MCPGWARLIEFGQRDAVADRVEYHAVHIGPHQKQSAAAAPVEVTFLCGVGYGCGVKTCSFICNDNIRSLPGYPIFDMNMLFWLAAITMSNGIGESFFQGQLEGKDIARRVGIFLTKRDNFFFNNVGIIATAGNIQRAPHIAMAGI